MIKRVIFNNKAYKIINDYGFKFANNEVTFNNITIDFTGCTLADIPYKYQEIKIMQSEVENDVLNGEILFTGYLENIKLNTIKDKFKEVILTLLSPLGLATKRSVSLIGTFDIKTAILRVIQPLINDGFVLKEINVPDGQITTNFILETVENCMNNIGFKRNIFWTINQKKEIFINDINYMFGLPISREVKVKEKGLLSVQPSIENINYANIINFKNVRLIYSQENESNYNIDNGYPICKINKVVKNGDIVNFENPIVVDEKYLRDCINETSENIFQFYSLNLQMHLSDNNIKSYSIGINTWQENNDSYNQYVTKGNITFSNDAGEEGEIVLQRDSFFPNLITGFKWNYNSDATIIRLASNTALRYATMKFIYSTEVEKLKNVVSKSGQIEKTIDYNEKWTSLQQLINYARSLMSQNFNTVNQVILQYDIDPDLKIGDIIRIDRSDFFIHGNFAVKNIEYNYYNEIHESWKIILKNSDLIETYIDMFRPIEKQEEINKINTIILSEFIEEQINEKHIFEIESENI